MEASYSFKGFAHVYLQGKGALQPVDFPTQDKAKYFVGSDKSKILIVDYRQEPNLAAKVALEGRQREQFSRAFNIPSLVEILSDEESAQIELRDCDSDGDLPTLWIGVAEGNSMPAYEMDWYILKKISDEPKGAYAILVS